MRRRRLNLEDIIERRRMVVGCLCCPDCNMVNEETDCRNAAEMHDCKSSVKTAEWLEMPESRVSSVFVPESIALQEQGSVKSVKSKPKSDRVHSLLPSVHEYTTTLLTHLFYSILSSLSPLRKMCIRSNHCVIPGSPVVYKWNYFTEGAGLLRSISRP